MEWLYYLLEANLYLLLFYGFYRLMLAKTTFYSSNRYYLLVSIILSFFIPLVQISFIKPDFVSLQSENAESVASAKGFVGETILQGVYFAIGMFLTFKLLTALFKIFQLWETGKRHECTNYTIVELREKPSAFSFFNVLFIHPSLMDNPIIIRHEMVHIREKHSLDLLFVEFIKIVSWFNPVVYLIKTEIKLLHEFIADEATTRENDDRHDYAMFLIESSLSNYAMPLTNQFFNQQILKKRIHMLNEEKTAKWVRLNFALTIPLLLCMLCVSTLAFSKEYTFFDLMPGKLLPQDSTKKANKMLGKQKTQQGNKVLPPPPPQQNQVKFPPPIVKPVQTNKKRPPAVEPPPPPKQSQIKFPPPVVKPLQKNKKRPPAVEPPPPKVSEVRFPPPIVRPKESVKKRPPAIEPPPAPVEDQVKFPPPIIKKKLGEKN